MPAPVRQRLGFRAWAILLVCSVAVPLLLFGWLTLRWMAQKHAETFLQTQTDTARVLASAVDAEVHAWKAALSALADSQALPHGRVAEFYAEAQAVAARQEGWILLIDPTGQQVLNTLRPFGTPLPKTGSPEVIRRLFQTGQPSVTDLAVGSVVQRPAVSVVVPVRRNDAVRYALSLTFGPERLTRLLQRQQLPAAWTLGLFDSHQRLVTRLPRTEEQIGTPAIPWVAAALRSGDHGIATGIDLGGAPQRIAFTRLTEAPWSVSLSIPLAALPSPRPVYGFIALGGFLGACAVAGAVYASRQLTRPVAALAANAERLLKGEAPSAPIPAGLPEIQALQEALVTAAGHVHALHHEEARAAVAEERAQAAEGLADALRAEAAQRQQTAEAQARLAAIVTTSEDAILSQTLDGTIRTWNAGAERLFGYPAEAILGHSVTCLLPPDRLDEEEAILHRLRQGEPVAPFETLRLAKDGRPVAVSLAVSPLTDAEGILVGVAMILRDITARKQAEQALQSVARFPDENPDPILRVTREGLLLYANRASGPLLRLWDCQIGHRLPADWCAKVAEAYARGQAEEVEILCEARVYACVLLPIATAEYLNLYLRDITARKQAEAALQQAKEELEQRVHARTADLSRALQQLSVQSDQLRALASELTLVEQRERVRLAEQIHDGLQQLLVAARFRVIQLGRGEASATRHDCEAISQLLDQAVADSRSLTAELSPPILRTGGLLAGLEWLARWSQEKHSLTVQVQAPAAVLPPLPEDLTVLLFQSVRELLFNVVKYAQVQGARLTLAWDAPGLTLTVADTGAGFHPGALRGEGGVAGGFGLARIRHRLELLGGCMTIESAPGQGTRVTLAVLLPTADQPAGMPAPPQRLVSPQPAVAPDPGSGQRIRILVVDDHQVVRRALAQMLRAEADLAVVGEAGTGTAAVTLARQLTPDVVLMDINMPEMNGIDATRAIHGTFPAMRVIGLSMFDRGDQQAAMLDAGAVAYVSKSAPVDALLAAIRGEG